MENFEQAKVNAAMTEESQLSPATLLPLAHKEKRAAETRSLAVLLGAFALALLTWIALSLRGGTILGVMSVIMVLDAAIFFAAAYVIRGARRKREIASITVATLEELCRFTPGKIRRELVQKIFADKLRRGAKARIGLKRGARPYTPQDKPGWKSVDYVKLMDMNATRKKNRGDRAAFLYRVAIFTGSCFLGLALDRVFYRFIGTIGVTIPITRMTPGAWGRAFLVMAIFLVPICCITTILMRRYWRSLTDIYAYGVDCEKDSFYTVWNEASHLYALVSKADGDQREGDNNGTGTARRRHRGGRGKKNPGQGGTNQAAKPEGK